MTLAQEQENDLFAEYKYANDERKLQIEEELVSEHKRLAYHIANRYFVKGMDREDLVSEAMLSLWESVKNFNLEHGAKFSTYAGKTIQWKLNRMVRDGQALKRRANVDAVSIFKQIGDEGDMAILDTIEDDSEGPEGHAVAVWTKKEIRQAFYTLPEHQQRYMSLHLSGMTYDQIAEIHTTTYRAVQSGISKARRRIRVHLEGPK